jgi:hypothetical protein
MDSVNLHPVMQKLAEKTQTYRINPLKRNIIKATHGTKLIIPEKALDLDYDDLSENDKVEIEITEYIDSFALAASGINLIYINNEGKEEIFESAGIFKINAQLNGENIELDEDKKIDVHFPNIVPGDKFNVYKLNKKGQWEYDGHNQEMEIAENRVSIGRKPIVISEEEKRKREKRNRALAKIYKVKRKTRIYSINKFTTWNFDYPEDSYCCITGSVEYQKEKIYQVFAIGLSRMGCMSRWFEDNTFKINFLKNTRIIIFIITEDGTIGFSKIFNTGNRRGTSKKPEGPHNYCIDIDKIPLKKVSDNILTNRYRLLKYLKIR